jgi:ribosomal protein S14
MATYSEASGLCPVCRQPRFIRKQTMSRPALVVHIVLSITSLGIWLLVFGLHALAYVGKKHRCTVCGTAVVPTSQLLTPPQPATYGVEGTMQAPPPGSPR